MGGLLRGALVDPRMRIGGLAQLLCGGLQVWRDRRRKLGHVHSMSRAQVCPVLAASRPRLVIHPPLEPPPIHRRPPSPSRNLPQTWTWACFRFPSAGWRRKRRRACASSVAAWRPWLTVIAATRTRVVPSSGWCCRPSGRRFVAGLSPCSRRCCGHVAPRSPAPPVRRRPQHAGSRSGCVLRRRRWWTSCSQRCA